MEREKSKIIREVWLGIEVQVLCTLQMGCDWKGVPCSRDMVPVGEGAEERWIAYLDGH
jgi:hypothetical protein